MSLFNIGKKAYLCLSNGKIFEGYSFGAEGTVYGEVVFTTTMIGYQETLTDPSYYGQLITQTFPAIGNYGINDEDSEADQTASKGYIVREWCNAPSNFRSTGNIDDFMKKNGVVGIHSIDTRCLTRILRDNGVMNGVITTENIYEKKEEFLKNIASYKITNAVSKVTSKNEQTIKADDPKYNVVVLDYGVSRSICSELVKRGCNVTTLPALTSAERILQLNPDGILLSNGPSDPSENTDAVNAIKRLIEVKCNIPMLGISLGHQLLAIANGAKIAKLKHGHRGENQPVIDIENGKTYITSQNHGYIVEWNDNEIGIVSHKNGNDSTCEGIKYLKIPAVSVQFSPETNGGKLGTSYIFEKFIELMNTNKKEGK